MAHGLLRYCNPRLQFVPMLSSACSCRERLVLFLLSSNFQSWGQAQKSKTAVMFNKVTGLLSKWCHIANEADFILSIVVELSGLLWSLVSFSSTISLRVA